jgi:tetratricopeptide (TPR) repeat protein
MGMRAYFSRCIDAYAEYQTRVRWPYPFVLMLIGIFAIGLAAFVSIVIGEWVAPWFGLEPLFPLRPQGGWFAAIALLLALCPSLYATYFAFSRLYKALGVMTASEARSFALYGEFPEKWLRPRIAPSTRSNSELVSDPLSVAEVYLSYGRRRQAIEVLQDALRIEPHRGDLRAALKQISNERA